MLAFPLFFWFMLVMNQVVVSRAFLNFETIMFKLLSEIGMF
jgi:hypothetical protein